MTILVDADACPVVSLVCEAARRHGLRPVLFCDTNHALSHADGEVVVVDAGADAADLALINRCRRGDVVITQDYGVAAMALAKGAYPVHQNGGLYTPENIDALLAQRHMGQKARRAGHRTKGPARRTAEDDRRFSAALETLLTRLRTNPDE